MTTRGVDDHRVGYLQGTVESNIACSAVEGSIVGQDRGLDESIAAQVEAAGSKIPAVHGYRGIEHGELADDLDSTIGAIVL